MTKTAVRGEVVYYLDSTEFTIGGRRYVVVQTESTGKGWYDAVDTVRNERGDYRRFTRKDLIRFINDGMKQTAQRELVLTE